jgi:uncharacterized protein YjiK
MKILLAIIAAASLVVGCGVIEEEQTTTDSGVGVTTSAPTTPTEPTEPISTTDNWAGTVQFGTSSSDVGEGIATDSDGNIYVTGYTGGEFSSYINAGDVDIFVAKYNSSGTQQWTQQLGTFYEDHARGIATDSSGNVYVTGHTYGGLDGNTSVGFHDLFVVKYDSGGIKQWTQQLGTSNVDFAGGIATDSSGNVYVTGHTYGSFDGNTNAGSSDLFVVKYDSGGIKQWTQQLGASDGTFARGIASDSSGNVYVTGGTSHGLFVIKYDSSGTQQWTQQLGTSTLDYANGISTDSSGNVYVTGLTFSGLDGNAHAGQTDIFVVKYNSSGVKQWTRQLGTSSYDSGHGITTDSSGNIYVTGATTGGLDGYSNAGGSDLFVVKYDSDGIKQWTQQLGSVDQENGLGITSDPSDNIYVTGWTEGRLDGDTKVGEGYAIIVKYDTDGNKQ